MKRFICFLLFLFCATAHADTVSIDWIANGETYTQTTCEMGGDLILPNPPQKTGYTFRGWRISQYIPIEYIESTGTQYIDTGITNAENTTEIKVWSDVLFTSVANGSTGNGSRVFYYSYPGAGLQIYLNNKTLYNQSAGITINANVDYIIETITTATQRSINVNGSIQTQSFSRSITDDAHIYTFGTPVTTSSIIVRLRNQKFYINSVLVRDFIPVLDENGTPCLFDKVENKFYYNSGTDDFIAGPIIYQ